jgi:hypothetical protein
MSEFTTMLEIAKKLQKVDELSKRMDELEAEMVTLKKENSEQLSKLTTKHIVDNNNLDSADLAILDFKKNPPRIGR